MDIGKAAGIERRTYTVEEAGQLLGVGRNQAYEAVRSGTLPSIKIGKRLLVPKVALDNMLAGGVAR
jgi:excisionase family DNA binding protein